jgi:antitoxin component of MazEF toxin-antitoxin module
MVKTITKVGNSHGVIFDAALMDLAHLKMGDQVNVEVHPGGTITMTPLQSQNIAAERAAQTAKRLIKRNAELFRRLS